MQSQFWWKQTPMRRRGAAPIVGLLLVLGVALLVWFLWNPSRISRTHPMDVLAPEGNGTMEVGTSGGPLLDPSVEPGIEPLGRIETEPLPYRNLERSYDGMGEISGEVFPAPNAEFPARWTLRIRPSKFAIGRERAIERDLELEGNQTTFEVRDLPLAAYTVQAIAEDQASLPVEVTLFHVLGGPPGAGKTHSRIMLRLEPFSSVSVSVTTHQGAPAADLPLWLESTSTGQRYPGRTDARGQATIQGLPEARYRVLLGHPERPLIAAEEVLAQIRTPGSWSGTLPQTETVVVRVVDALASPLPDAIVRGHGPTVFEATSDSLGEIVLPYLPHGVYQIRSTHAQSAGSGQLTLQVPAPPDQETPLLVYCRP